MSQFIMFKMNAKDYSYIRSLVSMCINSKEFIANGLDDDFRYLLDILDDRCFLEFSD